MPETNRVQPKRASGDGEQGIEAFENSPSFLQRVMDAFPDPIMVIDHNRDILLANRAARDIGGERDSASRRPKCFRVLHHRHQACATEECLCPLQLVTATRAPVTVVHTHRDLDGQEIFTEVTAAPIFNDTGAVRMIVESCRDITDRKRSRRFLEITNRHVEMEPLLEEFTAELKAFTRCAVANVSVLDQAGRVSACAFRGSDGKSPEPLALRCLDGDPCLCLDIIGRGVQGDFPYCTERGSVYLDCPRHSLGAFPNQEMRRLYDACERRGHESFALVPIRLGDRGLGLIYVGHRDPGAVSRSMVEVLEQVALELGTAIQRIWAEAALRAAHDQLEARVRRRTVELTQANQALQKEIAERMSLEQEILKVGTREQRRIGQELHDGLGQELTGLSYLAKGLHQKLEAKRIPETRTAAELASGIPLVLGQLRAIVRGLIPPEVDAEDLPMALEALLTGVEEQTGIACRFESDTGSQVEDNETAVQIYRIVQEAVANAVKHGRARRIVATLKSERDRIELEVRDDGIGIQADAETASGCGLRIMRHRARAIGGHLTVCPGGGGGTVVTCVLRKGARDGDH